MADNVHVQVYTNLDEDKIGPICHHCGKELALVGTAIDDALRYFGLKSKEELETMMDADNDPRCEYILQYNSDESELIFYLCIICFEKKIGFKD